MVLPLLRGPAAADVTDMSMRHPQPARPLPEQAPQRGPFRLVGLVLAVACVLVIFGPAVLALLS